MQLTKATALCCTDAAETLEEEVLVCVVVESSCAT